MGHFYNINNDTKKDKHYTFGGQHTNSVFDENSTYAAVLKVFREAFHAIDYNKLIRK